MKHLILIYSLLLTDALLYASSSKVEVLKLPDISSWEKQVFLDETLYQQVKIDNKNVLKATSHASASGLVRKIEIDLNETPYMNWSWKVDSVLENINEKHKSGDDYAARVYIVISGGFFFWRSRAISYTWSSSQPEGSNWLNAFTDNAVMVAMQSGDKRVGEWVYEKRNILEDVRNLLGSNVTSINAVAIMSDTDNSKQAVTAYYGDIYFTPD